jgi:hypothetical protein
MKRRQERAGRTDSNEELKEKRERERERERERIHTSSFVSDAAAAAYDGSTTSPGVKKVETPLTVAYEKAFGVKSSVPALVVVVVVKAALHHQIMILVFLDWYLERHVRHHGFTVHPPYPLCLRVLKHQLADQQKFGPTVSHFRLQLCYVVKDFDAVETTVVDLVLYRHKKKVISH